MRFRPRALLSLALFLLAGCHSIPREVSMVDYTDGVDEAEATIMVERYLYNRDFCSACYSGPVRIGHAWAFWLEVHGADSDLILDDVPPIMIDASSGQIRWDAPEGLQKRWLKAFSEASRPALDGIHLQHHH